MTKRRKKTRQEKKQDRLAKSLEKLHLNVLRQGFLPTTQKYEKEVDGVVPVTDLRSLIVNFVNPEPIFQLDVFEEALYDAVYTIHESPYPHLIFQFENNLMQEAPPVLKTYLDKMDRSWYFRVYLGVQYCNRARCHKKPGWNSDSQCICGNPLTEERYRAKHQAEKRRLAHEARKRRKRLL